MYILKNDLTNFRACFLVRFLFGKPRPHLSVKCSLFMFSVCNWHYKTRGTMMLKYCFKALDKKNLQILSIFAQFYAKKKIKILHYKFLGVKQIGPKNYVSNI